MPDTQRIHVLYPDGNERTFHTKPQFFEESVQKCLGGCIELWDPGAKHPVLAVHESQLGPHNRLASARYGVNARGPVAVLERGIALDILKEYI
jgi:hypothetical protein